jgi:hypothetical protein
MTSTLPQGPYGFIPVRSHAGGVAPRAEAAYNVATAAGSIFSGDLVKTSGTGRNVVQAAAADTKVRGVFRGVQYTDNFGNTVFSKVWITGTATNTNFPIVAMVYDDPSIIYKAQVGNGSIAAANLNAFYKLGGAGGGSTLTGVSGMFIDAATHTASVAGTQAFALNLSQIPGNDYGGFTELEVLLSLPELAYGNQIATGS